ncbi:Bug family tripartite tricarboxylate transporter substrate binding protein [Hydrogenophaga sp. ANAO-22]|jgi:tripartite-type tricarboxylate transporter receptor subunit TctC|uniref:Bug family tripartite tricarboxylate transporter substrate binding protein n=1 Tax=Hydrogenophaga sp. ANAO-22 TaxID=3166645 RepID=UPI0036D37B19
MQRRTFMAGLAATAATGLPLGASGETFPTQSIKIYGGFGPGSSSDVVTRLMAPQLHQALGQPIVIDNIQGAAGNIAAAMVAKARPDGYTLLSATNSMLGTNPHLFPNSGVQLDSFVPIAPVTNIGLVVVAGPAAPAQTLEGVLEASRRGRVTYGTPGAGTPMHLIGEMLRERSKGDLSHIPYKGGSAMVTDLTSGQVAIGIVAYTPASGLIKAGQLKPLAVCGTSRLAALPNVPAVAEVVPGVTIGGWFALMAPAGTPDAICRQIASAVDKALAPPHIQAQLIEMGCDRLKGGPDAVRQLAKAEYDLSGDLIRRLNIRPV